ncbi:MAG: GAF domain-containing protein [Cytophagales bacterium]|nr:GAF domain-containing protein [Cytophagales bacterium]
MSNSDFIFTRFLRRMKSSGSGGILAVFSLSAAAVFFLLFLVIEYNQSQTGAKIDSKLLLQQELATYIDRLEKETLTSYQSALLFTISNAEIKRFEAIYAIKNLKRIFDELRTKTLSAYANDELAGHFNSLQQSLSAYNKQIVEAINRDGKFKDILNAGTLPEDAAGSSLLTERPDVDGSSSPIKIPDDEIEQIRNQLTAINGLIKVYIQNDLRNLRTTPALLYVVFAAIIILLLLILYRTVTGKQKESLSMLSGVLDSISQGELPDEELTDKKSLKGLAETSDRLVRYLDDASRFARKIGDGDFEYEFTPKSDKDALGTSLIDMRNRLQEIAREDKIRNWINEGQAKFGEILRLYSHDIQTLGNKIIIEIVEYLSASQGALFIVKDDENQSYLELLSAYAYKRKKYIEKRIEIGEGLAGQAYEEGKSIYLTDIKTDHYNIQTGLGVSMPSSLLIVPLKQEDRIEGVVEIASLSALQKHEIEFVESIGESIASSLSAGKINLTTKKLLEETQEKAEQMKAQEEELRQNMEELAATQEQMARRNTEMEDVQQQLTEERYLLNALLNSTHDRIYFKDRDSKFIRVSRSMVELFQKKDESEIIGKSDFDFGFEEHAREAYEDEQKIIRTDKSLVDAIEKEKWDDGRVTWVSTTKNPLKDLDGNIVGTFGISRDVTESKKAEVETIKRKGWLDSFFKFHPVGFVVLNQKGQVSFASNSILTKLGANDAKDLSFEDLFYKKAFADFLIEISFESTKDEEIELSLILNDKAKSAMKVLVISGSAENEDGTQNIFLIQQ